MRRQTEKSRKKKQSEEKKGGSESGRNRKMRCMREIDRQIDR